MHLFDIAHQKNIEATFSVPEFAPALKTSVYFICAFLRYSPVTRLATPIFVHAYSKNF